MKRMKGRMKGRMKVVTIPGWVWAKKNPLRDFSFFYL